MHNLDLFANVSRMDADLRKKQRRWLLEILEHFGWSATELARRAGLSATTLTRFINSKDWSHTLSGRSIDKIERATGVRAYENAGQLPSFARSDADPYMAPTGGKYRPRAAAIAALINGSNSALAFVLKSRALEHAGFIPGDVLIVDTDATPKNGDVVLAQVYDRAGGVETLFRIFERPYLSAATSDATIRRTMVADDEWLVVRGVVVHTLRCAANGGDQTRDAA